jgi:hypothetical protein
MAKKGIIGVISLVIVGFSFIIIFPIPLLSINLSLYGIIDESRSFTYEPSLPSPNEKLYINTDVGNIEIQYTTMPVNYHVKIDVNFEMSGANLTGKDYSYFFNIIWETTNSSANLTLELLSESWFDDSLWVMKNVDILVTIRADIVFDIITNIDNGNFDITVPWAVSIGNLLTNVSEGIILYDFDYCTVEGNITGIVDMGDIFYDFDHCTLEGNITGIINEGKIYLNTDNAKYTRSSLWEFNITFGDIDVFIYQNEDLGANITGIVSITNGNVFVFYKDNSPDIGANLEIPYGNDFMPKSGIPGCLRGIYKVGCLLVIGFNYTWIGPASEPPHQGTVFFISDDLLANIFKYYYNLTFEIREGLFDMDLTSIG